MSWIRALFGASIGFIILRLEGWPVSLILELLNLPSASLMISIYFGIGVIIGLISGSTIWGIISSIILMPSVAVFYAFFTHSGSIINYFQVIFQTIPIVYLGVGGLIGGVLSEKYLG